MPRQSNSSTKVKHCHSWKRKSAEIKAQKKWGNFVVIPSRPAASDYKSYGDQHWSLDHEMSTDAESATHKIVLDARNLEPDPFITIDSSAIQTSVAVLAPPQASYVGPPSSSPNEGLVSSSPVFPPADAGKLSPSFPQTLADAPQFGPTIWSPQIPSAGLSKPPSAPVKTTIHPEHCMQCENVFRVQADLSRRRRELLTNRTHVQNEQELLGQIRESEFATRETVIKALSSALEVGTLEHDLPMIKTLQEKSLSAYRELNEAVARFNKAQRHLSSLEYQFGKKEGVLYELVSGEHVEDGFPGNDALASAFADSESTDDTDSEDMPSLLEEYYDRVGDVNIEWERLQELEADHRRDLRLRERSTEEQRQLMPSEETFIGIFFEQRAEIIRNFLQAKTDARGLRRQCLNLNYSIQDGASVGDLAGLDVPKMTTFAEKSNNVDPFGGDASDRLLQLLLIGEVNRNQRTEDWLIGDLHTHTDSSAKHRASLWESRKAYSEIGPQEKPEATIPQAQSEVYLELRGEEEAPVLEDEVEQDMTEYSKNWAALTRIESSVGDGPPPTVSIWRPELSLQRRYSSPELGQIIRPV
jgi:hypothetical protein